MDEGGKSKSTPCCYKYSDVLSRFISRAMAEGLLDSNRNEPKSEKQELEGEDEDFSLRCGWRSCRPDSLQRFVNPKWFISAISLFSLTQGMFTVYFKGNRHCYVS